MSLGIFSFDLAALINSLSNFVDTAEPELVEPTNNETSLDKTEAVLQNASAVDSSIGDAQMAEALNSSITSVLVSTENVKKETVDPKSVTPTPIARVPSVALDEETKREIERLIKSLQTSVIHSYQSTDIIDETVSLKTVANFPRREFPKDNENKQDTIREEKRKEENKLQVLHDQLKRSIMKNNSDV